MDSKALKSHYRIPALSIDWCVNTACVCVHTLSLCVCVPKQVKAEVNLGSMVSHTSMCIMQNHIKKKTNKTTTCS